MSSEYFVGLDLGQVSDYSALTVAERKGAGLHPTYEIRHLDRLPLGVTYPAVVDQTVTLLMALKGLHAGGIPPKRWLSIDGTGVGRAVTDLFHDADLGDTELLSVSIHGGDTVTFDHGHNEARVPKRDLVGVVQVALQGGRIKISPRLPLASVLTEELGNFRMRFDPKTSHDGYASWREAIHDDLVLSLAIAIWRSEYELARARGGTVTQGNYAGLDLGEEEDYGTGPDGFFDKHGSRDQFERWQLRG